MKVNSFFVHFEIIHIHQVEVEVEMYKEQECHWDYL
jgi:hypothetical protein